MNKTMTKLSSKVTAILCALTLAAGTTAILAPDAYAATYVGSSNKAKVQSKTTSSLGAELPNTLASHTDDSLYIQQLDEGITMTSLDAVTLYGTQYEVVAPKDGETAWTLVAPEEPAVNPTTGKQLDIEGVAVFALANDEGTQSIVIAIPKANIPAPVKSNYLNFVFTIANAEGTPSTLSISIDAIAMNPAKEAEELPEEELPVVIIDEQDGKVPLAIANVDTYDAAEPTTVTNEANKSTSSTTVYNARGASKDSTTITATVTSEDSELNDVIQAVRVSNNANDVTATVETEVTENTNGNVVVTEEVTTTVNTNTANTNTPTDEGRTLAQTADGGELSIIPVAVGIAALAAGVAMVAARKAGQAR